MRNFLFQPEESRAILPAMATTQVTPNPAPSMGLFMTQSITGEVVQIDVDLIKALFAELGYRSPEGDTSTLVIIPLALHGDAVDFHLSFTAKANYTQQCHFCVRLEGRQNECLYWFYSLRRTATGSLAWSWDGCAGQGDAKVIQKHCIKGVTFSSSVIHRFLDLVNSYMGSKVEIVNNRVAVLNDNGKRTGTRDQLTLQKKS
jgi:hypothetical protein